QEILERIDWLIVDSYFIVQVWPSRSTGRAHATDELAPVHSLSERDIKFREVSIPSGQASAVIDFDEPAIAVLPAGKNHFAPCSRDDGRAPRNNNVLPGVKFVRAAAERIAPPSKTTLEFSI